MRVAVTEVENTGRDTLREEIRSCICNMEFETFVRNDESAIVNTYLSSMQSFG